MGAVAIAPAALGRAGIVYKEYIIYETSEEVYAKRLLLLTNNDARRGTLWPMRRAGRPGPPDTRNYQKSPTGHTRRARAGRRCTPTPGCVAQSRQELSEQRATPFATSHLGAGMAVAQSSSLSFSSGTSNGGPIHSPEESKL